MADHTPVPIAIVGIGCRLPGDVADTEQLWQLLAEGRNAWSPVPAERYNEDAFYHPDPDNNGTINHRGGHFLSQNIAAFDAAFFGVSLMEAHAMDPQQRLLLEVTYEAFENAGIPIEQVRGSNTSVYVATFTHDYDRSIYKDPGDVPKYQTTGTGDAITSNRISYTFDLKGPSMTLDTGCSGSMVALHQACQSLRTGESSMALASGVNLIVSPDYMIGMSNLHMLNEDGRSYSFDIRGSGYGRGEGVTTVLLKRLDDALLAGDNIRAIIRNTAVNQDGKTSGITLPSQQAQEDLERSVFKLTGIDTWDIPYLEAHGTGTTAGDQAELQSIARVFCGNDRGTTSLLVGSIKSNIGHLESSSGLAGLIKTVLILEKGLIPPNADFQMQKPSLNLEEWKIKVPTKLEIWPTPGTRRACVNSFGYGGTNAHVILEAHSGRFPTAGRSKTQVVDQMDRSLNAEYQDESAHSRLDTLKKTTDSESTLPSASIDVAGPQLFVISARSEGSAVQIAEKLQKWANAQSNVEHYLHDLAYNLSSRRSMMQWRYSLVAGTHHEFIAGLTKRASGAIMMSDKRQICFVLTGQGAQWAGMGRELLKTQSRFAQSIARSEIILRTLGASWGLVDELELKASESRLHESEIAQPASTALQIALVDLLATIGITPEFVIGHSSGEIGAAYAAGVVSQETALKIAYCRSFVSRLCRRKTSKRGAMLSVGLSEQEIIPFLSKTQKGVASVACVNSPSNTTISGDEAAVLEISDILSQQEVFNRRLDVDTAYHSHHMREVAQEYRRSLGSLDTQSLRDGIIFISTVTAEEKLDGFGSAYWVENLVSKVRFCDALQKYCEIGLGSNEVHEAQPMHALIEIGPHKALATPIRQTFTQGYEHLNFTYLPTLLRDRGAVHAFLETTGKMFDLGHPVDLTIANALGGPQREACVLSNLPTYPWDHTNTYWHESRLSKEYRLRTHPAHDLLGVRIPTSTPLEPSWRHIISIDTLPWLADHVVDGLPIFPGAGYLCMAIEASRQILHDTQPVQALRSIIIRHASFFKALVIPSAPTKVELQLCLRLLQAVDTSTYEFRIYALSQDEVWFEHCRGQIIAEVATDSSSFDIVPESSLTRDVLLSSVAAECVRTLDSEAIYDQLSSNGNGNAYGPCFAAVSELSIGNGHALSQICIPNVRAIMPWGYQQQHIVHPTTLDALMHAALPLYIEKHGPGSIIPATIEEISISTDIVRTPGSKLVAATTLSSYGTRSAKAEISVFEDNEQSKQAPVMTISGADIRGLGGTPTSDPTSPNSGYGSYEMKWSPDINFLGSPLNGTPNNVSTTEFLKHLRFKHSQMVILEIEAGRGQPAGRIIRELNDENIMSIMRYHFTDRTTDLFQEAQGYLKEFEPLLQFRILNIRQNPLEQGFAKESVDLVIAMNLFSKEHDIDRTLGNIRKLLKRSGRLICGGEAMCRGVHLEDVLLRHGFDGVELYLDNEDFSATCSMGVSKVTNTNLETPLPSVEILAGDGLETFAKDLVLASSERGFRTSMATWATGRSEAQAVYVVLDNGANPVLANPSQNRFHQISNLVRGGSDIFWITAQTDVDAAMNPLKGLIAGFSRTARAENADLNFVTLDVREPIGGCLTKLLHNIMGILSVSFKASRRAPDLVETEYAFREGTMLIPRLVPASNYQRWVARDVSQPTVGMRPFLQSSSCLRLNVDATTPDESFSFTDDDSMQRPLDSTTVEISVRAHHLIPEDATSSLASLGERARIRELSGIVSGLGHDAAKNFQIGDRVCAWTYDVVPYANCARVGSTNVSYLPDSIPMTLGATIPIPFMTAYYALIEVADLEKDQSILVYGAASDVGQAAIQVANHIGARVLASVSDNYEREELQNRFGLRSSHIFPEKESSLSRVVRRLTKGRGADMILALRATGLSSDLGACIAPLGVIVRLSQPSISIPEISLWLPSDKHATAVSLDLITVVEHRPKKLATLLENVMSIVEHGKFPVAHQITALSMAKIGTAFKEARSQTGRGKVVLEVDEDTHVKIFDPHCDPAQLGNPRLDVNATYVIAGGLGDLGQKLSRFMISCGARTIVLLSRRQLTTSATQSLEEELCSTSAGLKIYSMGCDIANRSMVNKVIASFERLGLPPVKGVIQCATILRDRVLERMTVEDFEAPLHTKVYGTHCLSEAFHMDSLDFFVMLASLSGVVGSRGQANYAAGNTYQDAFANSLMHSGVRIITLDLGMVEDTDAYKDNEGRVRVNNLLRQGWIPVKSEEVLRLFAYAISPEARRNICRQLVTGINGKSIHEAETPTPTMKSAMFIHVRGLYMIEGSLKDTGAGQSYADSIAKSDSLVEVCSIVSAAISRQLSNITAFDQDQINLESPLLEFGLDSLLAIELKNWISIEFDAPMQASEILDEPSVTALTAKVASRSKFTPSFTKYNTQTENANINEANSIQPLEMPQVQVTLGVTHKGMNSSTLPRLPLPDLAGSLDLYLTSARSFLSDEQLKYTCSAIEEFQKTHGQQLQERLIHRREHLHKDNWQYDLQIHGIYLNRRDPIHPYGTFYGGHVLTEFSHGQAERAAVISAAAFDFKQRLDAGDVEQEYMNEEPLCMDSLKWLFNATREPGIVTDKMCRYPGNDYLVALRRGHVFKVPLAEKGRAATYSELKAKFKAILDSSVENLSAVAALSAVERDSWAELRGVIRSLKASNKALLEIIETSAFIVCLDDGCPLTPSQRCNQFLLGDPGNRWSDKTLQFVVCENGISAYVCEHAMVDAISLKQINRFITQAITTHEPEIQHPHQVNELEGTVEEYSFTTTSLIEERIDQVQRHFKTAYVPAEFSHSQLETLGSAFLQTHKMPFKTGLQLVIQLASLIYYGRQYPSWEILTMMLFHKGRLDWMQVVSPAMFAFCKAAVEYDVPEARVAKLLRDAANAHTVTMARTARGLGYAAHLEALREVLHEDELVPELFKDPTWAVMHVTGPRKIKTDASEGLMAQEAGFFMPDPESVWVHYEVEETACMLYIQSTEGRTAGFCQALKRAAEKVKCLLELEVSL